MIIQPKVRGFICTTAHPVGCAAHVQEWIDYVCSQPALAIAPRKVLIIGGSTGFGLAARIVTAFGGGAKTIAVSFEKEADQKRTASAGWYNTAAFENEARQAGLYAKSFNGDAFSKAMKEKVIQTIKTDWEGGVDLVVYSIAAPRRQDPDTGEVYSSTLKPIGQPFKNKTVDAMKGEVSEVTIDPASEAEIENTVKVMGGDDWQLWIEALLQANVLAEGVKTVAFTYIGPTLTHAIYRNGTIGKAKEHLEKTAGVLQNILQETVHGDAYISVNKALVTQASAAIPVVPLYISLLYKVMKEKGLHEGCIEQMYRLIAERLYCEGELCRDNKERIRIDDWEMRDDVQAAVAKYWEQVNSSNLEQISDLSGYRNDFYRLFGFNIDGVDYEKAVDPIVKIESMD